MSSEELVLPVGFERINSEDARRGDYCMQRLALRCDAVFHHGRPSTVISNWNVVWNERCFSEHPEEWIVIRPIAQEVTR